MERRILSLEEIKEYAKGVPVTEKNKWYVEREESIGMMLTYPHREAEGENSIYARFNPGGFRIEKRRYFLNQKGFIAGIKKSLYNLLSRNNSDLGEILFIGNIK